MPQTSIARVFPTAVAGLLDGADHVCETCILTEDGPVAGASAAGLFVEYDTSFTPMANGVSGVRFPQTTSTGGTLAGVTVWDPIAEPGVSSPGNLGGPWKKGQTIRVLRKGRIWAAKGGTAYPTANAAFNVMHSSTVATHRGKVTGDATSSSAGVEIQAATGAVAKFSADTTAVLMVIELNLPA